MDVIRMFRQLLPYMACYRRRLLAGFLFIVLGNIVGVINPQVVRRGIDSLQGEVEINRLIMLSGLVVLIAFVQGVFRFFMRRTVIVVSRLIENDMRNELFERLQSLSQSFFQRHPTGDLMARMTSDLNAVRSVLGPGIMYTINTLVTLILVLFMMLHISPTLTLIAMIPIPVMVFVVNRFTTQINRRYSEVQAQYAAISTRAQENLSGIRIVKSYVREWTELKDFERLNLEYIRRNLHYVKVHAAFRPAMMLIVGISVALVLLIGGRLIIRDVITLGEFVAFNLYLGMLVWPSIALGWVLGIFYQGVASIKRLNLILEAEPEICDAEKTVPIRLLRGEVEIRNLHFVYPGEQRVVLENINVEADSGTIVALIGRTGSGKSTLIRLLLRLYDAPENTIFYDGYPIHKIPLRVLRENIGYVPQETFLFSDTIANNIAWGKPDAPINEIEWAARMAQMHETILEFPEGYQTLLGERGINLSGGQKQRLTLARALLKQPRILLLDDALSAVDNETEEAILTNLREVMQGKTCFWVSHRISAVQHADLILVMDQGRIIERGTHRELLQLGGLYADLYEKQKLEEFFTRVE